MPKNVSTGRSIVEPLRSRVVMMFAAGCTIRAIAKAVGASKNTITAVRDSEWTRIESRKPILAAQAEAGALEAADKIREAVANGDIKGAALIPAYGVFFDKALAARGDPGLTIKHEHTHTHQVELVSALNKAFNSLSQAKASTITDSTKALPILDATPIPNPTDQ